MGRCSQRRWDLRSMGLCARKPANRGRGISERRCYKYGLIACDSGLILNPEKLKRGHRGERKVAIRGFSLLRGAKGESHWNLRGIRALPLWEPHSARATVTVRL